ncbi:MULTISPECIES: hypothetical protein [Ramlibacter]|uniref:Uncharacterized protein n=1 Tax=Ramlibacter pinisoli TaxID=2682844 RepID=A0A6N8IY90_9BURK|nr:MULTISPECIES: hypothetical protein [Ramlibacter]MBA2961845.1 hypothetical protein [Ramlibacter sp. CGMCC 1.13660]MVQ31787.1 hypothetical protein [Ramlibacter pinisoli]
MSPSWTSRFTAVIRPDRAALVRRQGSAPQLQLQAEAPCAAATPQAAAAALADVLSRAGTAAGELTIVLSNEFVQYLLVSSPAQVGNRAELSAFAAVCFDETFGADPGRVILTGREQQPGVRIAAALGGGLLAGLRETAARSPLRVVSIQPYLSAVFNRLRRTLPPSDFAFLVAEPDRSCLMLANKGAWRSVRNTAVPAKPRELANLIEREAVLAGLGEHEMPPIFVHAPGQDGLQVPACQGVVPRTISCPGAGGGPDPLLAMAGAVA